MSQGSRVLVQRYFELENGKKASLAYYSAYSVADQYVRVGYPFGSLKLLNCH